MALHGQEMMLKEQLDGVVIAVPTHMHLAIAEVPWQSSFVEYVEYPHLYMFFFSWEFTTKINNVEITDLHMLHPCVP